MISFGILQRVQEILGTRLRGSPVADRPSSPIPFAATSPDEVGVEVCLYMSINSSRFAVLFPETFAFFSHNLFQASHSVIKS